MNYGNKKFILYTAPSSKIRVDVLLEEETRWLTQKALCELLDLSKSTISEYLSNILKEG